MGRLSTTATTEQVLIFANPIAGRGLGERIARHLEGRFREAGFLTSTCFRHPGELQKIDLSGPVRSAIVIGGDGTLREVAERLIRADILPPLLPVPLGTANLMGKHLGIRWDESNVEERVIAAVRRHRILPLDAARANGRLMLLVAGVGYDAQVIHELDRLRRGPISFRHYLLPALIALRQFPAAPLRVVLDGREIFPQAPALAFVGNLAEYGTGFPILPHARPDDGLLDVCVVPCRSRSELLRLFLQAAAGEHTGVEGVVYRKGRRVRIESPVAVPVQVDGDAAGHTPLEIDLLPVRLPFIVPQGSC